MFESGRSIFRKSKFLSIQDLQQYLSFSGLTILPLLVSLCTLPIAIHTVGIDVWQSIITGQGIGLLLAEVVDGGWVSLGPRIMSEKFNGAFNFRTSLVERFPRLVLCISLGILFIQLTSLENSLLVSVSFLIWVANGFDIHWLTIATGNSKYSSRYVVVPRILGQILGIFILILTESALIYLATQLFFTLAGLIISSYRIALTENIARNVDDLPKGRAVIVVGNLFKTSTTWVLIVIGSILFQSSFAGLSAILRYLEILISISMIVNQSNHARHISTIKNGISRNRFLHSLSFSILLFVLSVASWKVIERWIFGNQTNMGYLEAFPLLATIPLRTLQSAYIQDNLIVQGKTKFVIILQSFPPIVLVVLLWAIHFKFELLILVPYFFFSIQVLVLFGLWFADSEFKIFMRYLTGRSTDD